MSITASEMTPADIAAVTGNNGRNGSGMFGGDFGAWWIIILFLFVFLGWGKNNGNGNGGNGGGDSVAAILPYLLGMNSNGGGAATQGALTREQACIDNNFQNLMRETAGISDAVNLGFSGLNSTICHQQYDTAMLANNIQDAVTGGFAALNSTICQQQYETAGLLNAMNMANMQNANAANVVAMQNTNAIQAQLAQCCCDQKAATEGLKFTIAQEDCNTRNLIQSTTRDMIDNANINTRAILDKLTQQEIAAKDAQIAAQNQKLFAAELAASQAQQNSYLINTLRPTPVPAYPASSPCGYNWAPSVLAGYGYGNGCGCACGA